MRFNKGCWAVIVVLFLLLIDQILKIWIKTHLFLGQEYIIADWFHLRFVENNGMAMGIEVLDKFFLSILRIIFSAALIYYIYSLVKDNAKLGYIVCVCMVLAGAVGNIIDCVFYGVIFDSSYGQVATLFPPGGGYETWLHGKVVDMFYFPIFRFNWPAWMPVIGGSEFEFFRYIFNVADASISVGLFIVIFFYRKIFSQSI